MEGTGVFQLPALQHAQSGEPAGHLSAACFNKQQDLNRHRTQAILNPQITCSALLQMLCTDCQIHAPALAQAGSGLSLITLSHNDAAHRLSVIGQQTYLPHIHAVHRLSMVGQ